MNIAKNKFLRVILFTAVTAIVLLGVAQPSYAHSQVVSSNPYNNQELRRSPKEIRITFSENISVRLGGIRLFNEKGNRVAIAKTVSDGEIISATIPTLTDGTYVVAYQVISADTHPIKGALIFSVGDTVNTDVLEKKSFDNIFSSSDSQLSSIAAGINRFILYTSLAMCIAILFLTSGKIIENNKKTAKYYGLGALICAISSILSVFFYSSRALDIGFFDVFSSDIIKEELTTRYGLAAVIRALVCGIGFFFVRPTQRIYQLMSWAIVIVLAFTLSLTGHAQAGRLPAVSVVFDAIHVMCASMWFGGLILISLLWHRAKEKIHIDTFSRYAQIFVGLIAVTGIFTAVRQIGSLEALQNTQYGRLVIVKILGFVFLVVVAFFTRRAVAKRNENTDACRILTLVRIEAMVIIVVMVATSILTNTVPAKDSLSQPVSKQLKIESGYLELTVDPAKAGPVDFHLYLLDENGVPVALSTQVNTLDESIITVTLSNKERNIVSIPVAMKFQSLNHFASVGTSIPFAGTWIVNIDILVSEFENEKATTSIKVG